MSRYLFTLLLLSAFVSCGDDVSSNLKKAPNGPIIQTATPDDDGMIRSGLHRVRGSEALSYAQEIERIFENELPEVSYHIIPNMEFDDESNTFTRTSLSRPIISCGTEGTFAGIDARIADCSSKNTSKANWNGETFGLAGEGSWRLVSLSSNKKEIWMDNRTGMLWSDLIVNDLEKISFNWCKASGNTQNATNSATIDCNDIAAGESVCAGTLTDGFGDQIRWRLPTRNDFLQADLDGLRFVLKKENDLGLWTATLKAGVNGRTEAWIYKSGDGTLVSGPIISQRQVRCIGAPKR